MINITAASVCSLACYTIGIQLRKLQYLPATIYLYRVHTLCKAINTQRYDENATIISRNFLSG